MLYKLQKAIQQNLNFENVYMHLYFFIGSVTAMSKKDF